MAVVEKVYSLDLEAGSSQYATITDGDQTGLDITGAITIEAWINPETIGANQELVVKHGDALNDSYIFRFDNNDTINFFVSVTGNGYTGSVAQPAGFGIVGVWSHVAVTFTPGAPGTCKFYVDGVETSTTLNAASIYDGTSDVFVGRLGGGAAYFDGKLAEVRVWDDVRTQTEIVENMFVELVGDEAGLVACWKLENDLTDETSNSNDLTAGGGAGFAASTTDARFVPFTYYLEDGLDNLASLDLESGSSQYATITDGNQTGLDLSPTFTIEFWIQFETLPAASTSYCVAKAIDTGVQGYEIGVREAGGGTHIIAVVNQNTDVSVRDIYTEDYAFIAGLWYHIAVTCDVGEASATTFEFFVNGVSLGNGDALVSDNCASIVNNAVDFSVGAEPDASNLVDGKMDDVRVWNDVRTSTEILENYENFVPSDSAGLVSNWKLNTDYTDEHANSNDLTAQNSPVFAVVPAFDARGSRRSLDLEKGSTQYATITDANQTGLDITGDITIECWVNFESVPGVGVLWMIATKYGAAGQRSWRLFLYNDGGTPAIRFAYSDDGTNQDVNSVNWSPSLGVWYHIAAVTDVSTSTTEFFVDGSSIGSDTDGARVAIFDSTAPVYIGRDDVGRHMDGLIDDFRIWNDKRTSTEIDDNKDVRLVGDETGLQAYWQLANNYADTTSNGNTLTPTNSPVFQWWTPYDGSAVEALQDIIGEGIIAFPR